MSIKRSPTKQASRRGSQSNRPAYAKRTKAKSRSATKSQSVGVFRPDLLEYNPIEKSGYSSLKIDVPEHEQFDVKVALVTEWHKCLKQHENYKTILVDSESTIDIVLHALHQETERLFTGYNWIFICTDEQEPRIVYYESLGDVNNYNVPLDWIYNHKNNAIRNVGLWLFKQLSEHFGIDIIYNDTIEMAYDNYLCGDDDDYIVISHDREQLDNGNPEDKLCIYEAVANIFSYKYGKPKELKALMRDMMRTYEEEEFKRAVIDNLTHDEELRDWLLSGYKLLKMDAVKISSFNLSPEDMYQENGDMVSVDQSVFFPYSLEDYVYKEYEGWLDSIANGMGVNDFFSWGHVTSSNHIKPENKEPLIALLKFLEQGQKIYKTH